MFDVLAVDAFTSDAIPIHLLTREAFAVYWRHLRPDGVLALHITNRYLNLADVAADGAAASNRSARLFTQSDPTEPAGFPSAWVLISSRAGFFDQGALARATPLVSSMDALPWTDDYSSLWRQLR